VAHRFRSAPTVPTLCQAASLVPVIANTNNEGGDAQRSSVMPDNMKEDPLPNFIYNLDRSTYFGSLSAKQRAEVAALLTSLAVRFEFLQVEETEERLRAWKAREESSASTNKGYEPFVAKADLDRLGSKLVELYPERKFDSG
jgi:hypothetical protein